MKYICDICSKYPCSENETKLMLSCPAFSRKPKPKTNADRIRGMSDEELAEMFEREISGGVVCPPNHTHKYCADGNCNKCWLDWLKQEAKE